MTTMIPVLTGEENTYALIALQFREAALETLLIHGCQAPASLTKAILRLNGVYHHHPDTGYFDPELAAQLGAMAAYRVLNGDIITIVGSASEQRTPAYIQKYGDDRKLQNAWQYRTLQDALEALRRWRIHVNSSPSGWVRDAKGAAGTSEFGVDHVPPLNDPT